MHLSAWNPISHCASLVIVRKSRRRDESRGGLGKENPLSKSSILGDLQENKQREAKEDGCLVISQDDVDSEPHGQKGGRSRSLSRHAQKEFLHATSLAAEQAYCLEDLIPSYFEAFTKFLTMYPKFQSTEKIDHLRSEEYEHLSGMYSKVCLDYCGFGLFSYYQSLQFWESSAFSLSEITANLNNHALYGGAEKGTVENDIKTRIMEYLNIPENEYGLVFTVSRGSAFKLLADSYPFRTNKKLLTMFDHESQSINLMAQSAKEKGAKVNAARFKWPTLKPCSRELRKLISNKKKRKKDSATGLFVFPVQSRVTGAKYSYQWMALAQQNNWHVLLDAGSLGPKDMDSLGLSLFRPDFIITSFYRVFGSEPTGFGCLLIKKSVIGSLQSQGGHTGSGIVRIRPDFPQYMSDSMDGLDVFDVAEDAPMSIHGEVTPESLAGSRLPAFSGVFTSNQVMDVFEAEMDQDNSSDRDGASTIFEETGSISVGEVMRSPISSEDESLDNSYWIDLGQSPLTCDDSMELSGQKRSVNLPPPWFSVRKNTRQFPRKLVASKNPLYEDKRVNNGLHCDQTLSFDAALLSVSYEMESVKAIPEEDKTSETEHASGENGKNVGEIQEEFPTLNSSVNGFKFKNQASGYQHSYSDYAPEGKESSAIRRETESGFRLLGRREVDRFACGRFFGVEEADRGGSMCQEVSLSTEESQKETLSRAMEPNGVSGTTPGGNISLTDADNDDDDDQEWNKREPEIFCRQLDHVDMLGLNKTTLRLRYLVNWLVTSLRQLHIPASEEGVAKSLVHIYGPKVKYERGASVAFNVRKVSEGGMIHPDVIQKLADKNGISLGVGFLSHIQVLDSQKLTSEALILEDTSLCKRMANTKQNGKSAFIRVEVVTASLGFLSNFEDVYKLWTFVAKFLNPSFVEEDGLSSVPEVSET